MRLLFVHTGGIGDFILACPALAALSRNAEVTLAGHPERIALAVAAGLARDAVSLDQMGFSSLFSEPNNTLRDFAAPFDEAVVWMRDDGLIEHGLRACAVGRVRCFPGLPQASWHAHASAYYLRCLGLPDAEPFRLALPPTEQPLGWVIHPGSGGREKNWPLPHFVALAAALMAEGESVHWCLGPAEENMAVPDGVEALRAGSLVELGSALASAKGYVGNDSGVTHLAAAAGCPTVAIFGPTNPQVWAPRGEHVRVVTGTPWPGLDDAWQALGL